MAHPTIRRIEITPADNGGVTIEVHNRPKKRDDGSGEMVGDYENNIERYSYTTGKEAGKLLDKLFPGKTFSQRAGKDEKYEGGGSNIVTFTGS